MMCETILLCPILLFVTIVTIVTIKDLSDTHQIPTRYPPDTSRDLSETYRTLSGTYHAFNRHLTDT
jgi:hypothetical protein